METPILPHYLQINPSLTSPTLVALKNSSTALVYLWLDHNSLTDVLLGLATDCLALKPKPFLLLKSSPPSFLFPDAMPTPFHNSLISLVHAVHSLKRCSRL